MKSERNLGLDILRFGLMILGIFLHTYCAYLTSEPIPEFPISATNSQHWIYDAAVLWIHTFRMPLFFSIAGFVSVRSLSIHSTREFLKRRWKRIAIPLIFCLLLLIPTFRTLLQIWPPTKLPLTFHMSYLWFLYYLLIINIAAALIAPQLLRWTQLWSEKPWLLCHFLLAIVTATGAWTSKKSVLSTSDGWLPDPWLLLLYSGFYVYGMVYRFRTKQVRQPKKPLLQTWGTVLFLLLLSISYLKGVDQIFHNQKDHLWLVSSIHGVLTVGITHLLLSVCLNMKVQNKSLATYFGASTYTVYLIHPLFLVPTTGFLDFLGHFPAWIPQLNVTLVTLFSLIVYHWAVRRTPLHKYL